MISPAGGGPAALLDAWRLGNLDGKPEGLAFTAQCRAVVALDRRKPRRNYVAAGSRRWRIRPARPEPEVDPLDRVYRSGSLISAAAALYGLTPQSPWPGRPMAVASSRTSAGRVS